jgi:IS30 family transposase
MIDYETYLRIHHLHEHEKLNQAQIAGKLNLHPDTVSNWLRRSRYTQRPMLLDPANLIPLKE